MTNRGIVPPFSAGVLFITVSAFGQPPIPAVFYTAPLSQVPPIGLAAGETAQVNVVNNATPSDARPSTAPSCTGTIAFYNTSGSMIGSATSFTVGSGQIFSVALPYASTGASGSRTTLRVAITNTLVLIGPQVSAAPPPCALASSLETYDSATGVTHAFVSGVAPQVRQTPVPLIE
jgi:hypothetical protein